MQIFCMRRLTNYHQVSQPFISKQISKAKDKNQDYIIIKDEKYYFRNKKVGKGYEFCQMPFNELLNVDESLLKDMVRNERTDVLNTVVQKSLMDLTNIERKIINLKIALVTEWEKNKLLPRQTRPRWDEFIELFKVKFKENIEFVGGFKCDRKNLKDYRKSYNENGIEGLIDKRGRKKGEHWKLKSWVVEMVKELYTLHRANIRATNIYKIVNKEAYNRRELSDKDYKQTITKTLGGIISISRVRDIINELKETKEFKYLMNPDRFKNSYLPAFGDMRAKAEYVNHYWEIDSTRLDSFAKLTDDSKETTWSLVSISDVKTAMKVIGVVKESNSQGIAELLYKAFSKLGIPENIVTDNGKDYLSKHTVEMLKLWGIKQIKTAPFSGEEKPFVERHFGTIQNSFTELLIGFKGHSVTQFQAINAQTKTADRLSGNKIDKEIENITYIANLLDDWIDTIYCNTHNSSLGTTPYEAYKKDEKNIRRVDIEKLMFAFGKQVEVTVGKKGIRYNKKIYNNLDGVLGSKLGEDFIMIVDLFNHNKGYLFGEDGAFICPLSTDTMSQESAINARNYYKQDIKEYEKNYKKVYEKNKDKKQLEEIIDSTKDLFKDQTPIEMIGGNGSLQNNGNIIRIEDISKEIDRHEDKIKTVNSKPNLKIHKKALEHKIQNDELNNEDEISYERLFELQKVSGM